MTIGRLWRTVRHLTAEQWVYRFLCRGQRLVMRHAPGMTRARIRRAADRLPPADPQAPPMGAIADTVLQLQQAVYGESFAGAADGRFTLLNRSYDFGSIAGISWRGEFQEGNNPLRRMNLAYMGYAVPLLARGRAEDLRAVQAILATLEEQNSWSEPGVFRDVWNAYTVSHRLINLLCGLALYRRADGPENPEAVDCLLDHVRFCAAFVRANLERDLQFNHLLKNYVALSVYAAACEAVPQRLGFLAGAVPRAVAQNILADGGHVERSPMYHLLSMLDVKILAAAGSFGDAWQAGLDRYSARMTGALQTMSLADGDIALFNDSWIGEGPRAGALAAVGSAPSFSRLPATGYVRLGEGGDSVVFDCGPCGPDENLGHAHADFLSVETTIAGHRFLVDTGVPSYTAGAARDESRSAAAHNGPRLDGAEPIEFWKSFRVGRRGYAWELDIGAISLSAESEAVPLYCAGRQSGYGFAGADIRRFVALWPGRGLLIADLWQGRALDTAVSSFLIGGRWSRVGSSHFTLDTADVMVSIPEGREQPPEAASHWLRYGVEEAAHRFTVAPVREADMARSAVLFSWSDNPPRVTSRFLSALFTNLAAAPAVTQR